MANNREWLVYKIIRHIASNGVLFFTAMLFSMLLMLPARADTPAGLALGGGMSNNMAAIPALGMGAQVANELPLLQPNVRQGDVIESQVEQIQGGNALTLDNEFQVFLAKSVGRPLPMYGYNLFDKPPSTFAPVVNIPVPVW